MKPESDVSANKRIRISFPPALENGEPEEQRTPPPICKLKRVRTSPIVKPDYQVAFTRNCGSDPLLTDVKKVNGGVRIVSKRPSSRTEVDSSLKKQKTHLVRRKTRFTITPVESVELRQQTTGKISPPRSESVSPVESESIKDSGSVGSFSKLKKQASFRVNERPVQNATYSEMPASLRHVVLPRDEGASWGNSSQRDVKRSEMRKLSNTPHGMTVPSLHHLRSNPNLLQRMLKQTTYERGVDLGSSDGRNLKVVASLTSEDLFRHGLSPMRSATPSVAESFQANHPAGTASVNPWKSLDHRRTWRSKLNFILTCIGASVGLGTFWWFPYLCLTCGRVAFFVPYACILIAIGIPLLLAELAVGQITRRGPIHAFGKLCPLMQGVGFGVVFVSFISSIYYNLAQSETILNFGRIFSSSFAWILCPPGLGVTFCALNVSNIYANISDDGELHSQIASSGVYVEPTVSAFSIALLGFWVLLYFTLWKSIGSISKVTSVSATVPFVLIAALLWRSLTLPGATDGLQFLFTPEWDCLLKIEVWVAAAGYIFVSLGVFMGWCVVFSSYNKLSNNVSNDVWLLVSISSMTSLAASVTTFSGIGFVAQKYELNVTDIKFQGLDFAFVIFPSMIQEMPYPIIWYAIFFVLVILLGIDSQMAELQVIVAAVKECLSRSLLHKFKRHEFLVAAVCLLALACSLPFIFLDGILFLFGRINVYILLMTLALFEVVTICSFYGSSKLCKNILHMTHRMPSMYFQYCWKLVSPLSIVTLWAFSFKSYKIFPGTPVWLTILEWTLILLCLGPVALVAAYQLQKDSGRSFKERLRASLRSNLNHTCIDCAEVAPYRENVTSFSRVDERRVPWFQALLASDDDTSSPGTISPPESCENTLERRDIIL